MQRARNLRVRAFDHHARFPAQGCEHADNDARPIVARRFLDLVSYLPHGSAALRIPHGSAKMRQKGALSEQILGGNASLDTSDQSGQRRAGRGACRQRWTATSNARELEKEIVETDACITEVQTEVHRMRPGLRVTFEERPQ